MDRIRIKGGKQLKGEIIVSGSKNACLPLMVAAMLTDKPLTLKNVPRLADITTMIALLKQHGVEISAAPGENGHSHGTTLTLQARKISSTTAPARPFGAAKYASTERASGARRATPETGRSPAG